MAAHHPHPHLLDPNPGGALQTAAAVVPVAAARSYNSQRTSSRCKACPGLCRNLAAGPHPLLRLAHCSYSSSCCSSMAAWACRHPVVVSVLCALLAVGVANVTFARRLQARCLVLAP
jgi:hypothetical protein